MCDSRSPDFCCCDSQSYRLQPCNYFQMCPPCAIECPNLPKLKPTPPQQNRNNSYRATSPQLNNLNPPSSKTPSKKQTQEKERNPSNSLAKKGNSQQKKNVTNSSVNGANIPNNKKTNKKSNGTTSKPKIDSPRNSKQNEGDVEADASCSNTELGDTVNDVKRDNDESPRVSANDVMLRMLQRAMDHTMRAYFMHTMEKMECLSAQLLRNEFVATKMHLDIVEKMSKLNQQSLAQFQVVVERLNSLLRDGNPQQICSCYDYRHYNSEEDGNDECSYTNKDPSDSNSLFRHSNQLRTTDTSRGSLQVTKSRNNKINKMTKNEHDSENFIAAEDTNQCCCTCREGSQISEHFSQNQNNEKNYDDCQRKLQSLQQQLESSRRELQETNRRLQHCKCRDEFLLERPVIAEIPPKGIEKYEEVNIPYNMKETEDLTDPIIDQNRQSTLKEEDVYAHEKGVAPQISGSDVEACCPECKCNLKKAQLDSNKFSPNRGR